MQTQPENACTLKATNLFQFLCAQMEMEWRTLITILIFSAIYKNQSGITVWNTASISRNVIYGREELKHFIESLPCITSRFNLDCVPNAPQWKWKQNKQQNQGKHVLLFCAIRATVQSIKKNDHRKLIDIFISFGWKLTKYLKKKIK